jgi:hypothetical protein
MSHSFFTQHEITAAGEKISHDEQPHELNESICEPIPVCSLSFPESKIPRREGGFLSIILAGTAQLQLLWLEHPESDYCKPNSKPESISHCKPNSMPESISHYFGFNILESDYCKRPSTAIWDLTPWASSQLIRKSLRICKHENYRMVGWPCLVPLACVHRRYSIIGQYWGLLIFITR